MADRIELAASGQAADILLITAGAGMVVTLACPISGRKVLACLSSHREAGPLLNGQPGMVQE
jgi:hypothetical protein